MLYLPIKRGWIISRTARQTYFVCAIAALCFFGALFASLVAIRASGVASLENFPNTALVLRFLFFPAVVGTAVLSVAMWYFWFGFDNSGWLRKAFWFVPLYLLIAIGPAFYYFLVYRRNTEVASCV